MANPTFFVTTTPTALSSTCDLLSGDRLGFAVYAICTGTPPTTASIFKHGCIMIQSDSGTGTNGVYQNTGSTASPVWTLLATGLGGSAIKLTDTNGVTALDVGTTTSAVNNLRVTDEAANRAPILSSVGASAAIGIQISPKSTGVTSIGTQSAIAVTTLRAINFIAGSGSSANTAVGSLVDANGVGIPLGVGLSVTYKLDSTFQAGANTFNLNGTGAKSVFKFNSPAGNIRTTVLAGAIVDLTFDGTNWLIKGFSQ